MILLINPQVTLSSKYFSARIPWFKSIVKTFLSIQGIQTAQTVIQHKQRKWTDGPIYMELLPYTFCTETALYYLRLNQWEHCVFIWKKNLPYGWCPSNICRYLSKRAEWSCSQATHTRPHFQKKGSQIMSLFDHGGKSHPCNCDLLSHTSVNLICTNDFCLE